MPINVAMDYPFIKIFHLITLQTNQTVCRNGFCSALSGIVFALSIESGWGRHLLGMELDVIAAVVIGGTLLTGGVGHQLGSVFGVLTTGVIRKFVTFGGLMSGYMRITTAALLFIFVVMQRAVIIVAEKNKVTTMHDEGS